LREQLVSNGGVLDLCDVMSEDNCAAVLVAGVLWESWMRGMDVGMLEGHVLPW
jgi:hypothetical protein